MRASLCKIQTPAATGPLPLATCLTGCQAPRAGTQQGLATSSCSRQLPRSLPGTTAQMRWGAGHPPVGQVQPPWALHLYAPLHAPSLRVKCFCQRQRAPGS